MGLARERRSAGNVRDSDGDFLWAQITDGLLGVLRFGRGGLAGAARVQTAPATVFPKSNVRTMTIMTKRNAALMIAILPMTALRMARPSAQPQNDEELLSLTKSALAFEPPSTQVSWPVR